MFGKSFTFLLVAVGLAASSNSAMADFVVTAFDNATVQPGGPRTGTNGKIFFNVEGSNNGSFASYGVIDFRAPVTSNALVTSLTLTLFQSNAAFSANGGLNFYLTQDTTTSIQPGASPLTFSAGAANDGIGSGLSPLTLLGAGSYTQTSNGAADSFTFSVPTAAQSYLGQQLSSGGVIRIVIAATNPGTAATYGGVGNFNGSPTLSVTTATAAVPEPSTLVLAGLGLVGAVAAARRRAA